MFCSVVMRKQLLTHLGSNQDSAEPKSDVLPITPWVNIKRVMQNYEFFCLICPSGLINRQISNPVCGVLLDPDRPGISSVLPLQQQ